MKNDDVKIKDLVVSDHALLSKIGVYKIYHAYSPDDIYVGSTNVSTGVKECQIGFYRRFMAHNNLFKRRTHYSSSLQELVDTYGISGIRYEIIEVCEKNKSIEREQFYLDTLNPHHNSSKTSAYSSGWVHTEEEKQRRSLLMKGNRLPEHVYETRRVPINQYDNSGALVGEYSSIQEGADQSNIDRASISKSAAGKRKTAGGFVWAYSS